MRKMMIAGLVLVALGVVALAVNVIPVHHQEQVAKIGALTVNTDKETDYVIPNYVGIIAIVAGVALVVIGTRRT
ncbi:MAG TPA: hypothetical protein VEU53_03745 [Stellaceae bacterium]|nr:hypothetical protein [Stellaceae bacterium]